MIKIAIQGREIIDLEHLVLDYNGTLAEDGKLIPGVLPLLHQLSAHLKIHVITADTFGTAKEQFNDEEILLTILSNGNQQIQKQRYVESLGKMNAVAMGNGLNDSDMFKSAALSVALMQKEGLSTEAMLASDIICSNIIHALELLIFPERLNATLRK